MPDNHITVTPPGPPIRIGIIQSGDTFKIQTLVPIEPIGITVVQPGDIVRIGIMPPPIFRINVSSSGERGLPGQDGQDGSDATDKFYIHNQSGPASIWTIVHNLNKFPSIDVVDSAGTVVRGSYHYTDMNTVTATFSVPFSGQAYLN